MTVVEFIWAAERFAAIVDEHGNSLIALRALHVPVDAAAKHAAEDGWTPERFAGFLDGLGVGVCATGND